TATALLRSSSVVEPGAELHCHWDPVIPFAGAQVDQRVELQLADDSRLYWSDAVMAGRVSRGEAWQFSSFAHELVLRIGRRIAYLERYAVAPCDRGVLRKWIAGEAKIGRAACRERGWRSGGAG